MKNPMKSYESHIADLDAAIAQRRAALIYAEKQRNGFIWLDPR